MPGIALIVRPTISSAEWSAMSSALREQFLANQQSTRLGYKQADAEDAQRERDRREADFQARVAATIATDGECRSAEESTSSEVATLKRKLQVADRADAKAGATWDKSRKTKATIDRQARERGRAMSSVLAPCIPECPFQHEPLPFDCAFMTVPVNVPAKHRKNTFTAAHAKSVSSAGHSLLARMEDFPTGTLQLILSSASASFITSTVNAACTLLFSLRVAYSKASTTPHWPTHLSARHGSDTDRR